MAGVTHIQLEPTSRCNFTCGFCCGRKMEQSDLSFETFEAVLAAFPETTQLELQGEGESFMHPRFFDMLARAKEKGVRISLITNGSFFSPENVDRFLAIDAVEKLSVSIESPDAAEFQEIRGGKFDKVVRGIELLVKSRKERGLDRPAIGFAVTVINKTRGRLREIVALYRRLGLDGGITVQPLQRMPVYTSAYEPEMLEQMLTPAQSDAVWVEFRSSADVRKVQKERRTDLGFHDDLMSGWSPGKGRCPWLDKGLYVDRNGVATACCMVKEEKYALGQVGVVPVEQILARRDAMRAELATGVIPEPCSGCELARFSVMSKLGLVRFAASGLKTRLFG